MTSFSSALLLALFGLFADLASAQNFPPNMPNLPPGMSLPPGMTMPKADKSRRRSQRQANHGSQETPPGVPISLDSPPMKSFQLLGQHPAYRMRMTMNTPDPQMAQIMAQMGFGPMETSVSGDTKQVIMRMKIPAMDIPGQVDDWEFRSVARDGRAARLISSPAVPRLLKLGDAKLAQQMEQYDRAAARSIAQSLAQGPLGWVSAGVQAASAVASNAAALGLQKKMHEFYKWQCVPGQQAQQAVDRTAPPPLTDLRVAGDQTIEGVAVTSYEFYVQEKGEFHGPLQMHVARDSGLPVRIEMSEPRMNGASMRMDYYDFDKVGEIEVPACLSKGN